MKMRAIRKKEDPSESIPANWNNPFANLKLDLPKEPPKPAPPPPTKQELKEAALDDEDRKLLAVFGSAISVGHDASPSGAIAKSSSKLHFSLQRKGKGGKTVTKIQGLEKLELVEQMELCGKVKTGLGCGARFLEGVLEIQGEQVERARAWFSKHGFSVS